MNIFNGCILMIAMLPIASIGAEYQCPDTLDLAVKDGWKVVELESRKLREKPHLLTIPRETMATLTHNLDSEMAIHFPVEASDAIDRPDGSVQYVWSFLPASSENPIYATCIFENSSRLYARKILPAEITSCSTERNAHGKYARILICH